MSIRKLPQASMPARPKNFQWDAPSDALGRWAELPLAASDGGDANTIEIYEVIGEDWWSGGGFTDRKMAAALRAAGNADVTVNINSPGGDMFEGIAIYNMLAAHPGKVTVNVMGLAASAASVIAMAGDEIAMGEGSFLMIHNAWGVVVGNRNDMRATADIFDGFDAALAGIYEVRTGLKPAKLAELMDAETFMAPDQAIRLGFADSKSSATAPNGAASNRIDPAIQAKRRIDASLASSGMPRSERRRLLKEVSPGMHDAAGPHATHDAGEMLTGLQALISTLQ